MVIKANRMTVLALLSTCALVAACGVDGEPIRPNLNAGVGISSSGVHVGGAVGVSKGPLNVSISL